MVWEFLASTRVGETRVLEVTWSMSRYSNSALFPRHDNPCQAVLKVSLRCHHASISKGSIIGCPQHICYQPRSSYWFYSNQECSIVLRTMGHCPVSSCESSHQARAYIHITPCNAARMIEWEISLFETGSERYSNPTFGG